MARVKTGRCGEAMSPGSIRRARTTASMGALSSPWRSGAEHRERAASAKLRLAPDTSFARPEFAQARRLPLFFDAGPGDLHVGFGAVQVLRTHAAALRAGGSNTLLCVAA